MNKLFVGDATKIVQTLPKESVDVVVTSPPYFGLRTYKSGKKEEVGAETSMLEYVRKMIELFETIKPVLKATGSVFLNIGDSYAYSTSRLGEISPDSFERKKRKVIWKDPSYKYPKGIRRDFGGVKDKSLMGVPWRIALGMMENGWVLRNDIIWAKRMLFDTGHFYGNSKPQPTLVDRFVDTKEYIFMFTKSKRYYFDKFYTDFPSVWQMRLTPGKTGHVAVFPDMLPTIIILAACPKNGVVLDPFVGSGTTALIAKALGCQYVGIDLIRSNIKLTERRLKRQEEGELLMSEIGDKQRKVVMRTFAKGKLRTNTGKKVTDKKQAEAIANSEARAAEERGVRRRTWKGRTRTRPLLKKEVKK